MLEKQEAQELRNALRYLRVRPSLWIWRTEAAKNLGQFIFALRNGHNLSCGG